jgi:type IV fimbrial biogenesis protein FimT
MKIRAAGFTLIELMVTVAIAAILLALAVPNFSGTLKASRTSSQIRELANALTYARSEAVARGQEVRMCPSSNQTSCGGTWSQGWIIFLNPNEDDVYDNTKEELLRVYQGVGGNSMKAFYYNGATSVASGKLAFNRNGALRATVNPQPVTFVICDAGNAVKYARAALVSTFGRTKLAMVDNGVNAKDTSGTEVVCP